MLLPEQGLYRFHRVWRRITHWGTSCRLPCLDASDLRVLKLVGHSPGLQRWRRRRSLQVGQRPVGSHQIKLVRRSRLRKHMPTVCATVGTTPDATESAKGTLLANLNHAVQSMSVQLECLQCQVMQHRPASKGLQPTPRPYTTLSPVAAVLEVRRSLSKPFGRWSRHFCEHELLPVRGLLRGLCRRSRRASRHLLVYYRASN